MASLTLISRFEGRVLTSAGFEHRIYKLKDNYTALQNSNSNTNFNTIELNTDFPRKNRYFIHFQSLHKIFITSTQNRLKITQSTKIWRISKLRIPKQDILSRITKVFVYPSHIQKESVLLYICHSQKKRKQNPPQATYLCKFPKARQSRYFCLPASIYLFALVLYLYLPLLVHTLHKKC